jgi:lambda family phage portal protein
MGWFGYNATDPRRKMLDKAGLYAPTSTANQLLNGSLESLRNYCRNLERNNPTARAGIEALTALVVGEGIGLEPDTGDEATDAMVRDRFNQFCDNCGVHGESIYHLQSLGVREMVTAGEGVWRFVPGDEGSPVPLRLLPLDAEWISTQSAGHSSLTTVAGVAIDNLGVPQAYMLQNPESVDGEEEVSAGSIVHFFERRRPVQHRGEPWFAPVIETLMQERDLVDAELTAAKTSASIGLAITSEYHDALDTTEYGDSDDPAQNLRLGGVARLYPGESVESFQSTRPSQQIAPFRQMLRGDIAAALRIPQRFLDRDVSRANYSSMRADMIDTERLLAPVRQWFGAQTIGRVYELVLPYIAASLGIAVPPARYRLVPPGQPYVDPQKDAQAALMAIAGGLSTYEAELGKRGADYRRVWAQRLREQKLSDESGLDLSMKLAAEPQTEEVRNAGGP